MAKGDSTMRVLDAAEKLLANNGVWPTIRELTREVGFASTNTTHYHLKRLEEANFIERDTDSHRHGLYRLLRSEVIQ